MSKRLTVARLEAWFRRLWRLWLGHVAWVAAVLGLAWQVPNPAGAFGIGILFGLRAGKGWRDRLRAERDEANALIDRWNYADSRRALDEADGVAPERPVELYDGDGDGAPICSWCEEPATTRVDVDDWENLPACARCVEAVRFGEVSVAQAVPDADSGTYARWIG